MHMDVHPKYVLCPCVQVWSRMSAACATMQAAAGTTWRPTWTDTTQRGVTCAICAVKSSNPKSRWRATDWATPTKVCARCTVSDDMLLLFDCLPEFMLLSIFRYQHDPQLRSIHHKTAKWKCVLLAFPQGSGFSVRSVTSPQSQNRLCSDTWSNTLSLRYSVNLICFLEWYVRYYSWFVMNESKCKLLMEIQIFVIYGMYKDP